MVGYYRLIIYGFLGLFLMGTGAVGAEPDGPMLKTAFFVQARPQKRPMENRVKRSFRRHDNSPKQRYRYNKARKALRSGRIVSLSVIRRRIRQSFPGKIVDVRLQEPRGENRRYIYIVKLLRKDGRLLVLRINAANARIISVRGNG
ncbi:MAG: hypothetical protein GXP02_02015 [Alphaproteobacteria bacterium]|nr:hypothetical protein [Alphaproteobacteria bacterium]